jgi:hypothetical protein
MRNAALTILCFVALGYAANAQRFSLLAQVGFENSNTKISYNDLRSFSPLGIRFSPQPGLQLNYSSKQGHGFFLGVASSRSIVSFSFTDPENGMNNFIATTGNMQLRLEGGYQFSTKPISLNGSKQPSVKKQSANNPAKKSCGSYSSRSSCMRSCNHSNCHSGNSNKVTQSGLSKNTNSWVRLQPSIGIGVIPVVKTDVTTTTQGGQTTYQYNAGNWKTALLAGAGFEFGRGSTRQFTVTVNYFKGIGNLNDKSISSASGVKSVTTTLHSSVSGWNMKVGIPFTLESKKPAIKNRTEKNTQQRSGCGQYRIIYRCGKTN